MKTRNQPSCRRSLFFSSQILQWCCQPRLFVAALLFGILALAGSARAQGTVSNCVTVICPPQVITNYTCTDVYTPASYPIVVSNNCPGLDVQVNCNPPPGTPLGVGAHPIHCTVTAGGQVVEQCDFWIIVERDTTPPSIKCPSNIVVNACPTPTGCGARVLYPPPMASDNSGSVSVVCNPPSGSVFPCGTTTVTCTAEDRCQLKAECQFTVTVNPNGTAPGIQCPADITIETCSNSATVVFTPVVNPTGTYYECHPPSGSAFPLGSTAVTCIASNGCGTAECTFKVNVRGVPPPQIQCPTNQFIFTVPCGSNCVPVSYPAPTVVNGALEGCNIRPGTCLPPGVFTVVCRATNDCGDKAICSFDIRVVQGQGEPPRITCPSNIVVTAPCGTDCVPVNYPLPTVSNGVLVRCDPPRGSCFPIGITTVTCFATNNCAEAACSFTVRVVQGQGQPPVITCPSNIVVETCRPNCDIVNYPMPTVSNGVLVGCNPPSGSCFPIGTTAVTCVASNDCERTSCTFYVTVRPVPPPGFQCPTAPVVNTVPCGQDCVPATYPTPTVFGGALVGCTPPPGTCLTPGVYTVVCTATNKCGVTNTCSFPLEVRPAQGEPPRIQCPTNDLIFRVPCDSNCVPVNYPLPPVSNGVLVGCTPPPGTCLPVGIYTVTCKATNDCSAAECKFTIRVIPLDGQPPVINCPSNITVTVECGKDCVTVNYPLPTVSNGTLAGCIPPPGTCFPIGVTTVHCRATNNCGQVAGCSFDIRVVQVAGQGPDIRCPSNIVVDLPCKTNCVPVNYPLPVVNNGVLVGCNPRPGTCLPAGVHVVTCYATNDCGSAACEFTITVRSEARPPVINCPSNMVVALPCDRDCVPVNYPLPTVSNGTLVRCTPPPGTCLPVGIYVVNCYATNDCGLEAKCEFQIRVVQGQGEPPVIRCPQDIFVTAPCDRDCVPVTYPAPFVTNGVFAGCNFPPGYCFPIGTNTVFCRATNACGAAFCSFRIIVRPGTGQAPPSIKCPSNAVVQVPCGTNCAPISYPPPTVSNGVLERCNPPIGTCLPPGSYVVTCTATNYCGQRVGCEFPLYVVQGQGHPPVIQCPSNVVVEVCGTNCTPVNYPLPTVFNGALAGCNPPPTFCFPIGFTPVTCVATNACGSNSCRFVVTVRQAPYPEIICPSNIVVTTCSNGAVVTYPPAQVLGSAADVNITCDPPSGSVFPIGTTVVKCCVTDRCNRINCCEFTVTVRPGKPCVKPPVSMVLWLPFDELVPPIAHNIVPGAPNGGHVGGPAPLPGQYVLNSLRFDGVNDFVRVPNYAAIMLSASDMTIDAWVLRGTVAGAQGRQVIVSKLGFTAAAGGMRGYEYYLNNGVMNLFLAGAVVQNFNSGVAVPLDGNWHHLAVTVRRGGNGQVTFYLDGAIVNVQGGPIPAPLGNNSSLFVGAGTAPAPNSFFRGAIDEVEIFRRALAPAEIFGLWNAQQSGKCKIVCHVPWDVPVRPGGCVTVRARICNNTPFPQTINWSAAGAVVTTPQSGSFILPPFTCTNIPVVLCALATVPPNSLQTWTLSVSSDTQCPLVCTGSVVVRDIVVNGPDNPTGIVGTNRPGILRVGLNGLPPGVPVRIRAIGPDMEPDMDYISLNDLPPGTPWDLPGVAATGDKNAKAGEGLDIPVRFTEDEPIGLYTILIEADLDGDGSFEPLASFGAENQVVTPPTIRIENGQLWWDDMGDGLGTLEAADSIEGPWTPIPGGPGTPVNAGGAMKFYRIAVSAE